MLQNKRTIDYMPVINHPVTKLSTVQELLRLSKVATDVIGQCYTICNFEMIFILIDLTMAKLIKLAKMAGVMHEADHAYSIQSTW